MWDVSALRSGLFGKPNINCVHHAHQSYSEQCFCTFVVIYNMIFGIENDWVYLFMADAVRKIVRCLLPFRSNWIAAQSSGDDIELDWAPIAEHVQSSFRFWMPNAYIQTYTSLNRWFSWKWRQTWLVNQIVFGL